MKNWRVWIIVGFIVASLNAAAPRASGAKNDEQEIRALEDRFAAAFRAKDANTIMTAYVPGAELFVFDVTPPRQHVGFDDYKKDWQDFCEYEEQLNNSITDQRMVLMCTYPLMTSGAAELLDVARNHQFAIAKRQGTWEVIETTQLKRAGSRPWRR